MDLETLCALETSTMFTVPLCLCRMELRRQLVWPGPRTMLNLLSAQWTEWYCCTMSMGSGETSSPPSQLTWRWRGLACAPTRYPRKLCDLPSSRRHGQWSTLFLAINLLVFWEMCVFSFLLHFCSLSLFLLLVWQEELHGKGHGFLSWFH